MTMTKAEELMVKAFPGNTNIQYDGFEYGHSYIIYSRSSKENEAIEAFAKEHGAILEEIVKFRYRITFPMTIKDCREQAKMSQQMFADFYGIPKRTIENWEEGKRNPPAYVLNLIRRLVALDFKTEV